MATKIYTLMVGILLSLSGIIFLIFPLDDFNLPDWFVGLMLLIGVVGIIIGLVKIMKKSEVTQVEEKNTSDEDNIGE